jgi:hypothetical protein
MFNEVCEFAQDVISNYMWTFSMMLKLTRLRVSNLNSV